MPSDFEERLKSRLKDDPHGSDFSLGLVVGVCGSFAIALVLWRVSESIKKRQVITGKGEPWQT